MASPRNLARDLIVRALDLLDETDDEQELAVMLLRDALDVLGDRTPVAR